MERNAAVAITPEALAKIVSDAVAFAIAAHEQRKRVTRGSGSQSRLMRRRPEDLAKLLGEMGLDEIEFQEPPPEADEPVRDPAQDDQEGVRWLAAELMIPRRNKL